MLPTLPSLVAPEVVVITATNDDASDDKTWRLWALSYYNDLTLSQEFQPRAAQLSKKAALPLAKNLTTASCRSSNTGPWFLGLCFKKHPAKKEIKKERNKKICMLSRNRKTKSFNAKFLGEIYFFYFDKETLHVYVFNHKGELSSWVLVPCWQVEPGRRIIFLLDLVLVRPRQGIGIENLTIGNMKHNLISYFACSRLVGFLCLMH